jgi:hypothetical protein
MQISKELADTLLKESPSFRKFVLAQTMSNSARKDRKGLPSLAQIAIDTYVEAMGDPCRSPKIAAIKAVRENSILLRDEILTADSTAEFTGEENLVSLWWAKEFVEKVCQCKV